MDLKKVLQPSERTIAILIGLGLVLYPIHSKSLTFGKGNETFLFLPWIGFGLILVGLIMLFDNKWQEFRKYIGPKVIWIPLLIIVLSAWTRIFVDSKAETFADAGLITGFFALYVAARKLGVKVLWAFLPFVLIEAISCIVQGIVDHGYRAGGLWTSFRDSQHTANYDIATCWLVLGTALLLGYNKGIKMRFLALIAGALYFVAAEEAIVALAGLSLAAIIRKDISKQVIPIVLIVALCLSIGLALGTTQKLYSNTVDKVEALWGEKEPSQGGYNTSLDNATTGRITVYKEAIQNIKPLGHGYEATDFNEHTVHNSWLIMMDQLGPLAALALLWVMLYCFWKSTWKYVWVAVFMLSMFDHYLITQAGPWLWVIIGLSTTVVIQDKVFNRGNSANKIHTQSIQAREDRRPVEVVG